MHARYRLRLRSEREFLVMVTAIRKEGHDELYAMLLSQIKELVDTALEPVLVGVPEPLVQVDSQSVEAKAFRHAEFPVKNFRVESLLLPEFILVDGVRRNIIAAHRPFLLRIPFIRLFYRPLSLWFCLH